MIYQAVLCICSLHAPFHLVIGSDICDKVQVCSGNGSVVSDKRSFAFSFAEQVKTGIFFGFCLLQPKKNYSWKYVRESKQLPQKTNRSSYGIDTAHVAHDASLNSCVVAPVGAVHVRL